LITLHAKIEDAAQASSIRDAIKARLRERFRIDHATVEIEHETCADERAAS
jgi:cobalt-zinc-cadmium efflux system protein